MKLLHNDNRFIFFQILILTFFLFILPNLKVDIIRVVEKDEKVVYIGVLGLIAVLSEIVGGLMKSKYLSIRKLKFPVLSSVFFFLFVLTKIGVFIGLLYIIPIAFTGDPTIEENLFVRIPTTLMSYLIFYIIYKQLKNVKENQNKEIKENKNLELIADILLFLSGFFIFSIAWFVLLNEGKIDDEPYYILNLFNGVFVYVLIYMSSYYYFYIDYISTIKSKKGLLIYWVTVLITAIIIVSRYLISF